MDLPLPSKQFKLLEIPSQDSFNSLKQDVLDGLFVLPRSLPPKYFYDDQGSKYFDEICKTQDYYPTRTEAALLRENAAKIIEIVNPITCTELGAGTSGKTEILLSTMSSIIGSSDDAFNYVSIDVCGEVLVESAHRLLKKYSNLSIESVVGEYIPAIHAAPKLTGPTLYLFIGSSIGNFAEQESVELLSEVAQKMRVDDYFLIGMDRVKDAGVLERAYDDSEGVTAKFNLNVLNVLNYKLSANFDLDNFVHQARYNEELQQIEMYLISQCNQDIYFSTLDKKLTLSKGEEILTEVSRKYTKASVKKLLNDSGLQEVEHFEPANEYFSLVLAKKKH